MRGFLVGVAGLMLWVLVLGPPAVAFLAAGTATATWQGFNVVGGIAAALGVFLFTLPGAALLAVFLDIRDRLEAIDRNTRR